MAEIAASITSSAFADLIDSLFKKKSKQKQLPAPNNGGFSNYGGLLTYPQPQITDSIDWSNGTIKRGNYLNSWGGTYYSNGIWGPGLAGLHEGYGYPDPYFFNFYQ